MTKQYLFRQLAIKIRKAVERGQLKLALELSQKQPSLRTPKEQYLIHKMNRLQKQYNDLYDYINSNKTE